MTASSERPEDGAQLDWSRVCLLEHADTEGWASHQSAAPPAVVEHFGIVVQRYGGATLMFASRGDFLGLNRALGVGIDERLTPAMLDEVIARYRAMGVTRAILQLCPLAIDAVAAAAIEARKLKARNRHAKLWRRPDPLLTAVTDLRIAKIDRSCAELYGFVAAQAYGDPPILSAGHSATIGQKDWRHYLAFDGDRPVATAALYIVGSAAWCGFAATISSDRGRGAHCALLAARVRDAAAEGCDVVVCETAEETPERPNPSFRNMRRMGFEVAYFRTNYMWSAT
jgi:hypothetical protein